MDERGLVYLLCRGSFDLYNRRLDCFTDSREGRAEHIDPSEHPASIDAEEAPDLELDPCSQLCHSG